MTHDDLDRLAHGVLVAATAGTTRPPDWLRRRLARGLAGVCLFGRNICDAAQVRGFTDALRAAAADEHPDGALLVAADEEGGDVSRLHRATGSPHLGALALGVVGDPARTRATARAIGADLAAAGVDWDFAPVADVNAVTGSPVIGTRSFGSDPDAVSAHVAAAVAGLHDAGILSTVKHFPGHGATAADSHTDLPRVTLPVQEVRRTHLAPFAAAVAAGTDAVMTGHLVVDAVDPVLPASLSPAAVRLLRDDLGFTGVVVTDALEMHAVADRWTIPGAAVLAVAAGADALCLSGDLHDEDVVDACARALVAAVKDGDLPTERLAQAAGRVARMRDARRAAASVAPVHDRNDGGNDAGTDASTDAGADADASLHVRGDAVLPPGPLDVVVLDSAPSIAAGAMPWHPGALLAAARPGSAVRTVRVTAPEPLGGGTGTPVVLVRDLHRHTAALAQVRALVAARPETVVVELGVPVTDPGGRAWVASSGASAASVRAVARRLLGRSG